MVKFYGVEIEVYVFYIFEMVCVEMVECYGYEWVYNIGFKVYISVDLNI